MKPIHTFHLRTSKWYARILSAMSSHEWTSCLPLILHHSITPKVGTRLCELYNKGLLDKRLHKKGYMEYKLKEKYGVVIEKDCVNVYAKLLYNPFK